MTLLKNKRQALSAAITITYYTGIHIDYSIEQGINKEGIDVWDVSRISIDRSKQGVSEADFCLAIQQIQPDIIKLQQLTYQNPETHPRFQQLSTLLIYNLQSYQYNATQRVWVRDNSS